MRVFLDACVLFPPLVRSLTLALAAEGHFTPLYSRRVLDEWRIASSRKQDDVAQASVAAAIDRIRSTFPDGLVEPGEDPGWVLPDPDDVHVLGAAIAGGADSLLTFNLRDFPRAVMSSIGIEARHPDSLFRELLDDAPDSVAPVIGAVLAAAETEPSRARTVLKRARLPRLGKAYEAMTPV